MKIQKVWIKIPDQSEKEEAQHFILSLAEEGLLGDIPVILYVADIKEKMALSHIYDVSEKALIPLYEKYGEENVKLSDMELRSLAGGYGRVPEADPLERIADSLEQIAIVLDSIADNINEVVYEGKNGQKYLCIDGFVDVRRIN